MSEPSPYAILLSCLQRNYGLGDTNIKVNSKAARNPKFIRFSMTVNEKTVEVTCKSKREGKQMASQKLLQILHPNIKSWSSLLKMYGSRAITAQKNKKEKESEVSFLGKVIFHKGLLVGSDYRKNLSMALLVSRDLYKMCHVTPGGPWKGFSRHA